MCSEREFDDRAEEVFRLHLHSNHVYDTIIIYKMKDLRVKIKKKPRSSAFVIAYLVCVAASKGLGAHKYEDGNETSMPEQCKSHLRARRLSRALTSATVLA